MAAAFGHLVHILGVRATAKMHRVDARRVVAGMKGDLTGLQRSTVQLEGEYMRPRLSLPALRPGQDDPVPMRIAVAHPFPTLARRPSIYLRPEALGQWRG
jgi:hypothetical protein